MLRLVYAVKMSAFEKIDLEQGEVNGHKIEGLPILPESVIEAIKASVEHDREVAAIDGRQTLGARAIGAALDLIKPLPDGDTWADRLDEATFMPPAKTIANGFGSDSIRDDLYMRLLRYH